MEAIIRFIQNQITASNMEENLDKEEDGSNSSDLGSKDETEDETGANNLEKIINRTESEMGEISDFIKAEYSNIFYIVYFVTVDPKTISPIHFDPRIQWGYGACTHKFCSKKGQ